MNIQILLKALRLVAILEAISWIALLVAMYYKWILGDTTHMNLIGRIHGFMFIGFVILVLLVGFNMKWRKRDIALSLLSSLPPCATVIADIVIFKRYAEKVYR